MGARHRARPRQRPRVRDRIAHPGATRRRLSRALSRLLSSLVSPSPSSSAGCWRWLSAADTRRKRREATGLHRATRRPALPLQQSCFRFATAPRGERAQGRRRLRLRLRLRPVLVVQSDTLRQGDRGACSARAMRQCGSAPRRCGHRSQGRAARYSRNEVGTVQSGRVGPWHWCPWIAPITNRCRWVVDEGRTNRL